MNYLEKNIKQFENDLRGLIAIDTVLYTKEDYPTQGMKDALSFMATLAEREGFKSYTDPEGYYGYMEIGEGDELLGIIGHLDVVNPGEYEDWKTNPFELTIDGNNWIGRGTQDMKGPVMVMFYLMKQIIEEGLTLNKRVRLVYPTDEESYWRGITKYNEKEETPTLGFTPDSVFPVTFLERESLWMKVTGPSFSEGTVKGGSSMNAVPDKLVYTNKEGAIEETLGAAAHASRPTLGTNAIQKFAKDSNIDHPIINFIKEQTKEEHNGETLFGRLIKDDYSELTFNVGLIEMNDQGSSITIDTRIPITETGDNLQKELSDVASNYGLTVERIKHHDKLLVDKEGKLVKTLINAYNEVMGTNEEPIAIGGGTYARAIDNVVAFGTLFADEPDTMHQVNESIIISNVIKAYDIFYKAMKELIN